MMVVAATQELHPLEGSKSAVWKQAVRGIVMDDGCCSHSRPPSIEGSKSDVWKHFGFPSQDGRITVERKKRNKVHCKLCDAVIKYWQYNEYEVSSKGAP